MMMDVHEGNPVDAELREGRGATGIVRRLLRIRRGEGGMVTGSIVLFFLILCGYYVIRPVREAMGISRGWETLPSLSLCTVAAMAVVYPETAWMFSRLPRRWALIIAMGSVTGMLVIFHAAFVMLSTEHRVLLGYVFYVWLNVINLLLVSLFWSLMNDGYSAEQSRRLFPLTAAGGTLGAIAGAKLTESLSGAGSHLQHHHFLLISAGILLCATIVAGLMFRVMKSEAETERFEAASPAKEEKTKRDLLSGVKLLATSPMVMTIAAYLFLYALTSNLLYYAQGKIVDTTIADEDARRATFASIDLYGNVLALACQVFLTTRLVQWLGVSKTLMVTPLVTIAGLAWITRDATIAGIMFAQVARRGLHYSVDRPPREALYGVLSVDAKYKAKNFVDTVVYRAGDVCGMLLWLGMAQMGGGLMWVATPLIVAWMAMALRAGGLYERAARESETVRR